MKSVIINRAEHLYHSGNVQEALQYYAACLWHGEEDSAELLAQWLGDGDLVSKTGEQAVCAFIASILFTIDRCQESLQEQLWFLCHDTLDRMTLCEDRQDTTDRYVVECICFLLKECQCGTLPCESLSCPKSG